MENRIMWAIENLEDPNKIEVAMGNVLPKVALGKRIATLR
jgi:hypothetical protein